MIKKLLGNKRLLIIITAAIAVLTVGGVSISSNAAMSVSAYVVDKGVIDSEVEVNGTVESNTDRSYYSDVSAKIATIHVKEGDFVKKGDLIISYDLEEIEQLEPMAELKAQADLAGTLKEHLLIGNNYKSCGIGLRLIYSLFYYLKTIYLSGPLTCYGRLGLVCLSADVGHFEVHYSDTVLTA